MVNKLTNPKAHIDKHLKTRPYTEDVFGSVVTQSELMFNVASQHTESHSIAIPEHMIKEDHKRAMLHILYGGVDELVSDLMDIIDMQQERINYLRPGYMDSSDDDFTYMSARELHKEFLNKFQ